MFQGVRDEEEDDTAERVATLFKLINSSSALRRQSNFPWFNFPWFLVVHLASFQVLMRALMVVCVQLITCD